MLNVILPSVLVPKLAQLASSSLTKLLFVLFTIQVTSLIALSTFFNKLFPRKTVEALSNDPNINAFVYLTFRNNEAGNIL